MKSALKESKLLADLRQNPFVLAPMAGITDCAFRTYMRRLGAGVVVSELVSATGLEYNSVRTQKLMKFEEVQRPVAIQLFGENPEHMAKAAQMVELQGADFVDINFGCPVPKVVKKGAGSAMLRDLPAMRVLLKQIRQAIQIPLTIKIRTGWDQTQRNALDVVRLAEDEGITWVAIHGRTRAQGYDGFADWDFIGNIKAQSKIPILGNGDIATAEQAVDRLKTFGLDGVLIGRGALKNPLIFMESLALWREQQKQDARGEATASENLSFLEQSPVKLPDRCDLFVQLREILTQHCDDHLTQIQLKKFAAWYSTGYAGAAQFRRNIFQAKSTEEVMTEALEFLKSINESQIENISNDGFLMGGHG
jgi:nifR3 family TIM-barrel protein